MEAAPDGGADGRTGLCNFRLKVIHILSVGVDVEMIHSFPHDDGVDGIGNGRGGRAVGHGKLISTAEHSITHWWCW